jgi:hypothetical protein
VATPGPLLRISDSLMAVFERILERHGKNKRFSFRNQFLPLSKKENKMNSFPFYNLFRDEKEVRRDFKRLREEEQEKEEKDHFFKIRLHKKSDLHLYKITDFFSEKCRIRCSFSGKKSPLQQFKNRIKHFEKIDFESYEDFDIYFRETVLNCSNFPVPVAVEIYKFFKPKRILDFSAGWGDRLIGALAYSKRIEYLGIDPSKCMKDIYKRIVRFFEANPKKYRVIKKPFEDYQVEEGYFDLVFTSPPFFNYEVYEKNKDQSIEKWKDGESWKTGFLFPALEKSYYSLRKGGHLVLYMENLKGFSYLEEMKRCCYDLGFQFIGTIEWVNLEARRKKEKIRKSYVWKKD